MVSASALLEAYAKGNLVSKSMQIKKFAFPFLDLTKSVAKSTHKTWNFLSGTKCEVIGGRVTKFGVLFD
jgi:hypothetical protein